MGRYCSHISDFSQWPQIEKLRPVDIQLSVMVCRCFKLNHIISIKPLYPPTCKLAITDGVQMPVKVSGPKAGGHL